MKIDLRKVSDRSVELTSQRKLMIQYLTIKAKEEDWHGVADAAMDLRDIESELKGMKACLD